MDKILQDVCCEIRMPLDRGYKKTSVFLEKIFHDYIEKIKSVTKKDNPTVDARSIEKIHGMVDVIQKECQKILHIFKLSEEGLMYQMYSEAFQLFDYIKDYLPGAYSGNWRIETYYRLRAGNDFDCLRNEMFHIPISMRQKVSTERYSVPGYPCLYIGSQAELCWYECKQPEKFTLCKVKIPQERENYLHLIDFSEALIPLKHSFFGWFYNNKENEDELDRIRRYFIKIMISMPLRAACSVEVKNKDDTFIEEYIMPQLLLQWVRENGEFDGIKYQSSVSADGEVNYLCGHDIVLPTSKFRKDGLCEVLTKQVKVATPVRVNINKIVVPENLGDVIKDIKKEPFHWDLESIPEDYQEIKE